jgi:hypothetical protein
VRNIAVALALRQIARTKDMQPFRARPEQVWAHSLEVAVLGHVLSRCCTNINADEAHFAGLVRPPDCPPAVGDRRNRPADQVEPAIRSG